MRGSDKNKVRPVSMAFEVAKQELGGPPRTNAMVALLNADWRAEAQITSAIKAMGQHHLVNLTHSYEESAMSLAFYAGDGIVTKVMRASEHDKSQPIYNVPEISSTRLETELDNVVINTYPWVPGSFTPEHEIEQLRTKMQTVGLDFSNGDDQPRNFHKMPDKQGTLVGIDASMYTSAYNGKQHPEELKQYWRQYMETMFPVYREGVTPQSAETSFAFRSIHDRQTGIHGFNSDLYIVKGEDPIIRDAAEELTQETKSIWNRLFGSWGAKPDAHEPS